MASRTKAPRGGDPNAQHKIPLEERYAELKLEFVSRGRELDACRLRLERVEHIAATAEWYITCLEGMTRGEPVRSLDEAKASYDAARDMLLAARGF